MYNTTLTTRDSALSGLRGIAASWVALVHAYYWGFLPSTLDIGGSGRAGVLLFFFLSGYLISAPFFLDFRNAGSLRSWVIFWLRRVFRIVPLYFLVLFATYALSIEPFLENSSIHLLFEHLLFKQGLSVFWTIVLEARYYLLFNLILFVSYLLFFKSRHRLVIMLFGLTTWLVYVASGSNIDSGLKALWIDKHTAIFISGVMTRLLTVVTNGLPWIEKLKISSFKEIAILLLGAILMALSVPAISIRLGLASAISNFTSSHLAYESFWDARLPWIGLLFSVFFFLLMNGPSRVRAWLGTGSLVWLGERSYGIYLTHSIVLYSIGHSGIHPSLRLISSVLIIIGFSHLLYRIIEQPIIELGKRLTFKLLPDSAIAPKA